MILTTLGRTIYALVAILNVSLIAGAVQRGQWIAVVLSGLIGALFGAGAVLGHDPLAGAARAPKWLGRPYPERGDG
jgi:hypothetical protein